jgi:hypothetical protein
VSQLEPLEVSLCSEGMARFCTEPYAEPNDGNQHKVAMHLTNYSLNKRYANFVPDGGHADGGEHGSKRTWSLVRSQLEV